LGVILFTYWTSSSSNDDPFLFLSAVGKQKAILKNGQPTSIPFDAQSDGLSIVGTADGKVVKSYFANQNYHPILTNDGDAIAVLWFEKYSNSTAGSYTELVVTYLASSTPKTISYSGDPFELLEVFMDPTSVVFIHKLWLSEQLPIDYGIEVLGLDKKKMSLKQNSMNSNPATLEYNLLDGSPLIQLNLVTKPSFLTTMPAMIKTVATLGLKKSVVALLTPSTFTWSAPKGVNAEVDLITMGDNPRGHLVGFGEVVSLPIDPSSDQMVTAGPLKEINFKPVLKNIAMNYRLLFYPPIVSPTVMRKK